MTNSPSSRTEIETLRSQVEEAHAALQRLDDDHAQLRAAVEQIAQEMEVILGRNNEEYPVVHRGQLDRWRLCLQGQGE